MKLKNLFIVGLLAFAFSIATANAQNYKTAFGARLGYDSGLTLKHSFALSRAVEGILSASPHYFQLTGLYEYQQQLPGAPGLDWYVGLGAHIGNIYYKNYTGPGRFLVGADLIAGLEYAFPTAPFVLSLDWKPTFNFTNRYNEFWYAGLALSVRYTFK